MFVMVVKVCRRDVNKKIRLSQNGLCVQPRHGKISFTCTMTRMTTRADERCQFDKDIYPIYIHEPYLPFQLFMLPNGGQAIRFKCLMY